MRGKERILRCAQDDGKAQDDEGESGADDGFRTRDLELGKLALYQLSYVRVS
jgi:hypothetical protein